jgi:hypothetical protein
MNYEFKKEDKTLSCSRKHTLDWLKLWSSQEIEGYFHVTRNGFRWAEDILYKHLVPKSKIIKALTC